MTLAGLHHDRAWRIFAVNADELRARLRARRKKREPHDGEERHHNPLRHSSFSAFSAPSTPEGHQKLVQTAENGGLPTIFNRGGLTGWLQTGLWGSVEGGKKKKISE